MTFWLSKNGSAIPETSTDLVVASSATAERVVAAWNFFVSAEANDFYELIVVADDTNVVLEGGNSLNATRGAPSIPSTILTVNQVG